MSLLALCLPLFVLLVEQIFLFTSTFISVQRNADLSAQRSLMGPTLALAKASAALVNFNVAFLILCKCRLTIHALGGLSGLRWLRGERLTNTMHAVGGAGLLVFAMLHSIAHAVNYARVWRFGSRSLMKSGTTITGWILLVLLGSVAITAYYRPLRKRCFELFWYTHQLSWLLCLTLSIHGAFCLLKSNSGKCSLVTSWLWLIFPIALYLCEMAVIQFRVLQSAHLVRAIVHPSRVIELQFTKKSLKYRPGQYMYVKIPKVSRLQWHPFTLTSAPHEDHCSVHINVCGNWTSRLTAALNVEFLSDGSAICKPIDRLPSIFIDGPYGGECEKMIDYDVVLAIGAGIGQTPFASILKSLW